MNDASTVCAVSCSVHNSCRETTVTGSCVWACDCRCSRGDFALRACAAFSMPICVKILACACLLASSGCSPSVLFELGWAAVALALAELDLTWGQQPRWAAPQSPHICSPLRAWSRFWLAPFGLNVRALFCTRTRARLLQTQLGLQLGEEEVD